MFMLFGGHCYYAGGGLNDYEGMFKTLEEALAGAKKLEADGYGIDWWQIVTIQEGVPVMVARTETTPHGVSNWDYVEGVRIIAIGA